MTDLDLFPVSDRGRLLHQQVAAFIDERVRPAGEIHTTAVDRSEDRWQVPAVIEELKAQAREQGLWNLFLADGPHGAGLSNLDYAPIAELTGHVPIAAEVFNCSAPDSGNMEVLHLFGSDEQKGRWLLPLLDGTIRSGFMMTEPEVASSDATNIGTEIRREGDEYVITGRKWWITNAGDPRCRFFIVLGVTDANAQPHRQQSMVIVPADTPGIRIERMLTTFGYDDAPSGHAEITLDAVRVPAANIILGEGRGFEIAQGRLGPGRIHHCLRLIGAAEEALALMCQRLTTRVAFGRQLASESVWQERIANARIEIDKLRLLAFNAAAAMDRHGSKAARKQIAMVKVATPRIVQAVVDVAIQAHGAAGLSQDTALPHLFMAARAVRFADGPDEVHTRAIAKYELAEQRTSS
ncbi:MAG: acyl-CoA dehydrogenase family protein [Mycobacterium sp.]